MYCTWKKPSSLPASRTARRTSSRGRERSMIGSATAAADAGGRWSGGKTKLSGSASWDAAEDNSWFSIAPSLSLPPSAGALATSGRIGRGAREIGERKSEGRARQRLTNSRSTRGGKKIALKAEKSRCALAFSSLGRSAQKPFAASSTADASYGPLYLVGPTDGCSPHVAVAPAGGEPTCCCAAVRQSADSRPRRERCRPPSN